LIPYINLKFAALGCPTCESGDHSQFEEMSALLAHQREINRLLANYLCPADNRIQTFLYDSLQESALADILGDKVSMPKSQDDLPR
jgi:phosphoenolpyruvate carboxykinase (diphosphate)